MFRTIKLPYDQSLLQTGMQFREACQMVLDFEKTYNKLNSGTYKQVSDPNTSVCSGTDEYTA